MISGEGKQPACAGPGRGWATGLHFPTGRPNVWQQLYSYIIITVSNIRDGNRPTGAGSPPSASAALLPRVNSLAQF